MYGGRVDWTPALGGASRKKRNLLQDIENETDEDNDQSGDQQVEQQRAPMLNNPSRISNADKEMIEAHQKANIQWGYLAEDRLKIMKTAMSIYRANTSVSEGDLDTILQIYQTIVDKSQTDPDKKYPSDYNLSTPQEKADHFIIGYVLVEINSLQLKSPPDGWYRCTSQAECGSILQYPLITDATNGSQFIPETFRNHVLSTDEMKQSPEYMFDFVNEIGKSQSNQSDVEQAVRQMSNPYD